MKKHRYESNSPQPLLNRDAERRRAPRGLALAQMAGQVCESCGTEPVEGARHCHSCGWRLDVAPIDIDIYDDKPRAGRSVDSEPDAQATRATLMGISAVILAIVAGAALYGWFARSDTPSAGPVPSTTASGDTAIVLDAGVSMAWHEGPDIGGLMPSSIVEYNGRVFVFAAASRSPQDLAGTGVDMWSTADGVTWESAGPVIESPVLVTSVNVEPDGLVAVGRDANGAPAIWRSTNGTDWATTLLPEAPPSSGTPVPLMFASSGDVETVVGTSISPSPFGLLLPAIEELAGVPIDSHNVSLLKSGSDYSVAVSGPLGLPILSASIEDLGLSPQEVSRIKNSLTHGSMPTSAVWSSTNGLDWDVASLHNIFPTSLAVDDSGRFVMSGSGPPGPMIWRSDLGKSWQDVGGGQSSVDSLLPWKQVLIGIQYSEQNDLVTSTDGATWNPVGLPDLFPGNHRALGLRLAAGEEGIAVEVSRLQTEADVSPYLTPAILAKDGYTLTANDGGTHALVLRRGEDRLIAWEPYTNNQAGIVADLGNQTITFVDPMTSEPYVTFTLEELQQLEAAANTDLPYAGPESQVLFTADAATWTLNSIDAITTSEGVGRYVSGLQVTSLGLITAITTQPNAPSAFHGPSITNIFIADYPS